VKGTVEPDVATVEAAREYVDTQLATMKTYWLGPASFASARA
jgi:hypothetical protein